MYIYIRSFRWKPSEDEAANMDAAIALQRADEQAAREGRDLDPAAVAMAETSAEEENGLELHHPFAFQWTDHEFTTRTGGFQGRLDYILPAGGAGGISDGGLGSGLWLRAVAPMPRSTVGSPLLLPSVTNPSDHISLLAQLEWVRRSNGIRNRKDSVTTL